MKIVRDNVIGIELEEFENRKKNMMWQHIFGLLIQEMNLGHIFSGIKVLVNGSQL